MASTSWVELFTDGSCIGNPGPGGWAYLLRYNKHEKEGAGSVPETTNNRMELLAVVEGLKALNQKCRVTIYTDSQWVYYGMTGRNKRKAHLDLWAELDELCEHHLDVLPNWVRAHNTHPENNRVDEAAKKAARNN